MLVSIGWLSFHITCQLQASRILPHPTCIVYRGSINVDLSLLLILYVNNTSQSSVRQLEHKTCAILAAERLRLMRFDNRLIIESFQKAICILKW